MKYLKSFNESSSQPAVVDDIRDLFIEFRDEWGFIETITSSPDPGECIWSSFSPNDLNALFVDDRKSYFFVRMYFKIKSQDIDACYKGFKEMCDRIESLEDIKVEEVSNMTVKCPVSKLPANPFFAATIFIPM